VLRVFRHYLSGSALCLFACEAAAIFLTLFAAGTLLQVTDLTDGRATGGMLAAILGLSSLNAVVMYSIGLYDQALIEHFNQALPRLIAVCTIFTVIVILTVVSVLVPGHEGGVLLYGSVAGIAFAGVLVARLGFAAVTRMAVRPRRVLVVGVGNLAAEIEYMMSRQPPGTTEVVGYVALIDEKPEIPQTRIITRIKVSLVELANQHEVKEIVVALSDRRGVSLQPLLDARMEGITITSYLSFWERETRRVNLQALDPSWLI